MKHEEGHFEAWKNQKMMHILAKKHHSQEKNCKKKIK
jgi:hypothetical protein